VRAAEWAVSAQKAERAPTVSFTADYGAGGTNLGNLNQVYSVGAAVQVPIYTGGRIRADIQQAEADLARRRAEYADLKGRVAYDIRVALLDVNASDSSVKVAERNKALAGRALLQSQDRFSNGVTNSLEVAQAQEALAAANENYIQSLFSLNIARISLARATGDAETKIAELLGDK
jgi:outer membrane protein TolC